MPKDYFDFHPYRFQFLTAAADARRELLESGDSAQSRPVLDGLHENQFEGISAAEFHRRLELMTEMRNVWNCWSANGSEILDFSEDMARMAGSRIVALPWSSPVEEIHPVYVHFGAEAGLFFSDRSRLIEGAYLQTDEDPRHVLVCFICNDISQGGTFGKSLVAQSEVIRAYLDRRQDHFIDLGGDPSLVLGVPKHEMLSRTLYAVAHILGPSPQNTSSLSRLARSSLN